MTTTPHLGMTDLATNQAQKETTINTNNGIVDAVLNSHVLDKDLTTPPGSPTNGDVYIVGASATGAWASQDGNLTYYLNGWKFVTPIEGLVMWVQDEDLPYQYEGTAWVIKGFVVQDTGEYWYPFRREVILSSLSGATATATNMIKNREVVHCISSHVTTLVTGATSFDAGDGTTVGKFGSTIGVALDATNIGIVTPAPYFADTSVVLTANGGNFTAGTVKLVLHGMKFKGPWTF